MIYTPLTIVYTFDTMSPRKYKRSWRCPLSNLARTLVHIPKDDLKAVTLMAKQMQVSRAAIIRWAISSYLQKNLSNCPEKVTNVLNKNQSDQQAA